MLAAPSPRRVLCGRPSRRRPGVPSTPSQRSWPGSARFASRSMCPASDWSSSGTRIYWKEDCSRTQVAVSRSARLHVRPERRRASDTVSGRRSRHRVPFQRAELRGPGEGAAASATYQLLDHCVSLDLRASYFSTSTILTATTFAERRPPTGVVWPSSGVSGRPSRRPSIARRLFASFIAGGRPRSGVMSRPARSSWVIQSLATPARFLERAQQLLRTEGFSWQPDGTLIDDQGAAGGVHHRDECG